MCVACNGARKFQWGGSRVRLLLLQLGNLFVFGSEVIFEYAELSLKDGNLVKCSFVKKTEDHPSTYGGEQHDGAHCHRHLCENIPSLINVQVRLGEKPRRRQRSSHRARGYQKTICAARDQREAQL